MEFVTPDRAQRNCAASYQFPACSSGKCPVLRCSSGRLKIGEPKKEEQGDRYAATGKDRTQGLESTFPHGVGGRARHCFIAAGFAMGHNQA